MDRNRTDGSSAFSPVSSPSLAERLDALRDHPEWSDAQRAEVFDRLVVEFEPEALRTEVCRRLGDLRGADGEAVLRLIEGLGGLQDREVLGALAEALHAQPDLPPERAWHALSLLDDAGLLADAPELAAWLDELSETLDDADALRELVEHLEDEPEGSWLALQGLEAVEPEIRAQIIAGLAGQPPGPGLVAFLRLLCFAHDPTTRAAALEALEAQPIADPHVASAWAMIAADHPDPALAARAHQRLGSPSESKALASAGLTRSGLLQQPAPRLVRSLITALDGQGRGQVVLQAEDRGRAVAAAFTCDVMTGLRAVASQIGDEPSVAEAFVADFATHTEHDVLENAPELALGLLAGGLWLAGPEASPALRFWLERTAGPALRPQPMPGPFPGWDPALLPYDAMPAWVDALLSSCRDWADTSKLAYDLAEEILLREGDAPPDPQRDAGAYRYFFEHRLHARLELYRRMLVWMASFWEASGDHDLGRASLALACQLADAHHAVAGHPFLVALTTHCLASAQHDLRQGRDPRRA